MPDEIRTCLSCFGKFKVTQQELDFAITDIAPNRHHPAKCPEGLDQACPNCEMGVYGPDECKSCRIKQDGQRS